MVTMSWKNNKCVFYVYIYIITITLNYLFEYCVQSYCPSPFDQITCLFR